MSMQSLIRPFSASSVNRCSRREIAPRTEVGPRVFALTLLSGTA
jgi:hypothetical protein